MVARIAYLTYADAPNPSGFPTTWIAEIREDPSPEPALPWVTVNWVDYVTLRDAQATAFATSESAALEMRVRTSRADSAHAAAWTLINKAYDLGGLIRLGSWLLSPAIHPEAKYMIEQVQLWLDAVMEHYLLDLKPAILAGYDPTIEFDDVGVCPYSFTQIYIVVNLPRFTTHPASVAKLVGETATLTVVTWATYQVVYQWQSKVGAGAWTDIPGATAVSYVTPVLALTDDALQLRCVATFRGIMSTASNAATLTVTEI